MNISSPDSAAPPPAFDSFVSYSRRDSAFAARLHKALEQYAPPAGLAARRGRLRVFRDASDFTGSEYYDSIESHLAASRKLIVICSPAAAASAYVDDEIDRFVALHGAANVVPVIWQGLPNNEATAEQADQAAFPPALCRALQMPLAVDFRGFDPASDRIDGEAHRSAWMMLLANLLGVSRAEIEQRELKRRRKVRRAWTFGISAVFAALLALTLWALFEGERALARQLAAQASIRGGMDAAQVERRVLLAREAFLRLARLRLPTLVADTALRGALAAAPRRRLALPAGERVVAFSGDGQYLLGAEGTELTVYLLDGGRPAHTTELARPLERLAASADLRFVAGIDDTGALQAWSWPGLEPIVARPLEVVAAPLRCLTFSEHGATLVALRIDAGDARKVALLRWRLGEETLVEIASVTLPVPVHEVSGEQCLFARDPHAATSHAIGAMLVAQAAEDGFEATVALRWPLQPHAWLELARSEPIEFWLDPVAFELDHNTSPVLLNADGRITRSGAGEKIQVNAVPRWSHAVALSRDGAWLATAQPIEDPVVPLLKPTRFDLIDTRTGTIMRSVADHAGAAAFAPDGETFATVSGQRIRLWDLRDGRERLRLRTAAPVQLLVFDPSSRQLAAVAADGALEVFETGAADESMRVRPDALIEPLAGSGEVAAVSGARVLLTGIGADAMPRSLPVEGHLHAIRPSPDGRWLVVGTSPKAPLIGLGDPADAAMILLELVDGSAIVRQRGAWGPYSFDRDSRRFFALGIDGHARMIDLRSGGALWATQVDAPAAQPGKRIASTVPLALADDGSAVAIGSAAGVVVLSGHDGEVQYRDARRASAVALSADGALLARPGEKHTIEVLRVVSGEVVAELDGTGVEELRALMFSPGARRLMGVGGTTFGTFFVGGLLAEEHFAVWDLRSGQQVVRVPEGSLAVAEYQATIGAEGDERQQLTGLVWNAHTREIAGTMFPSLLAYFTVPSSMVRGSVMAWQLTDAGLVETYRAGNDESLMLRSMAARGGAVVASGEDGYRRVIDLSGQRLLSVGCEAVHRPLSAAERAAHLGSGFRRPLRCPR